MSRWRCVVSKITVLALLAGCLPAFAAEDVAALIKRQSQEFSDASAIGNAAVFDRYLDDRVTFMNEDGSVSSKHDILTSAGPPPKGMSNHLVQTDFNVEVYGTVAVTRFTDQSTVTMAGQVSHANYRSTEVWLKEAAGWRMISSQTIAVPQDPPAIALPVAVLDEYVGTYKAGPDVTLVISRQGNELADALNGGKPRIMKAEARDVLFTPGQPRLRKIVQRDANGRVVGIISRRDGHDALVLKRTS
ncbi:nuclear transport factor 2 family protein [Rhodanobacter sp. C01]|uniref:nuclear transport factor 2 family protein n=1 Tax=Rhodanobacter sp. C01 TaxID=1945856 RepID=UPI0014399CC8|nr:nuclear transport factor 2 family protein [Rhodanobacter sp. C01]